MQSNVYNLEHTWCTQVAVVHCSCSTPHFLSYLPYVPVRLYSPNGRSQTHKPGVHFLSKSGGALLTHKTRITLCLPAYLMFASFVHNTVRVNMYVCDVPPQVVHMYKLIFIIYHWWWPNDSFTNTGKPADLKQCRERQGSTAGASCWRLARQNVFLGGTYVCHEIRTMCLKWFLSNASNFIW